MSDPRDVINDSATGAFETEPTPLPPAPRPFPDKGQGIAETIDRVGIAEFLRQMERTTDADQKLRREEQAVTNRRMELLTNEVRDGFRTLGERILPTLERIERVLSDHNGRIVELEQRARTSADQIAAERRERLALTDRVTALETAQRRKARK